MWTPSVNFVHLCAVAAVSSVCVLAEHFYFLNIENTNITDCSEHGGKGGTALSAKQCCADCARNGKCRGVVYNHVTMACNNIHTHTISDIECQAEGGTVYSIVTTRPFPASFGKIPLCDRFLVSGPHGVADNQLSESSYWCDDPSKHRPNCEPWEAMYGSAKYARLNGTGMMTGGWIVDDRNPPDHYIQVDFLKPTVVTQVVMQARDPAKMGISYYVTRFRFQHSDDCSTFKNLADNNGEALILEGNSNKYDTIYRDLPKRVKACCFRTNPIEWTGGIALRFDLIGCPYV